MLICLFVLLLGRSVGRHGGGVRMVTVFSGEGHGALSCYKTNSLASAGVVGRVDLYSCTLVGAVGGLVGLPETNQFLYSKRSSVPPAVPVFSSFVANITF